MPSDDATTERGQPADPLAAVAGAAGARLRAQIGEDAAAGRAASEAFMTATMSAMSEGHSLRDITAAEARGEDDVRNELRGDVLKRVDRAARNVRDAEATYHAAIGRAVRLGLSTRQIAHAAGVTHGTIRALAQRLEPSAPEPVRPA
jgi:hypothetical protein